MPREHSKSYPKPDKPKPDRSRDKLLDRYLATPAGTAEALEALRRYRERWG